MHLSRVYFITGTICNRSCMHCPTVPTHFLQLCSGKTKVDLNILLEAMQSHITMGGSRPLAPKRCTMIYAQGYPWCALPPSSARCRHQGWLLLTWYSNISWEAWHSTAMTGSCRRKVHFLYLYIPITSKWQWEVTLHVIRNTESHFRKQLLFQIRISKHHFPGVNIKCIIKTLKSAVSVWVLHFASTKWPT